MNYYRDNFTDYKNARIVVDWTQKLWNNHVRKHPEIKDLSHTSTLIRDALSKPSLVVEGQKPGDGELIVCYYKEHKRHGNDVYYTKVVIGCNKKRLYVKTVFARWTRYDIAVQEKKYNFKEIFRDSKTYL